MLFVREEVGDNYVRDDVSDVEDTRKVGLREVHIICGGLVVLCLGDVDFGYALDIRRRIFTSCFTFGQSKIFPSVRPTLTSMVLLGSYPRCLHWARRYSSSVMRTHFQLLSELGISQVRLARFYMSLFQI